MIQISNRVHDALFSALNARTQHPTPLHILQLRAAINVARYLDRLLYRRNSEQLDYAIKGATSELNSHHNHPAAKQQLPAVTNAFYSRINEHHAAIRELFTQDQYSDIDRVVKIAEHSRDILTETRDLMVCYPEYYERVRFIILSDMIDVSRRPEQGPGMERGVTRDLTEMLEAILLAHIYFDSSFFPLCKDKL